MRGKKNSGKKEGGRKGSRVREGDKKVEESGETKGEEGRRRLQDQVKESRSGSWKQKSKVRYSIL